MRLAYLLTHPIQYQSPLIRHLRAEGIDLHVIYGSSHSVSAYHDREFGVQVAWDVPLLDGYPHEFLCRDGKEPKASKYERLLAAALDRLPADALWVHGWSHPLARAGWRFASKRRLPLLLRGETHLGCLRGGAWRRLAHRLVFIRRFRQPAAFLAVGSANRALYRAYGVPAGKMFDMPYAVDNAFFQERARAAAPQRDSLRASFGISPEQPVVLFCGKLIPKKDPETLIRAFASAVAGLRDAGLPSAAAPPANPGPVLLIVGEGEMRHALEQLASVLAPGQVLFTGFKNQTELPALYDLCDLFVIPSLFEPWGLVVNEVMNAARPVLASNRVGAAADLIQPDVNGGVFPAGDVESLARLLSRWLMDPALRLQAGQASLDRIRAWGFEEDARGLRAALDSLVSNTTRKHARAASPAPL